VAGEKLCGPATLQRGQLSGGQLASDRLDPRKEVYVYVMEPRLRQFIHGDERQPLSSRTFLLAQRGSEKSQSLTKRMRMKRILASWKPKLPPKCELSLEDLETVGRELNEFTALFEQTFGRSEPAALFELYLQGLLSDAERKNVEAIALKLDGPERRRNLQRFLSNYQWGEPWMRARHWELCVQTLATRKESGAWMRASFPRRDKSPLGCQRGVKPSHQWANQTQPF